MNPILVMANPTSGAGQNVARAQAAAQRLRGTGRRVDLCITEGPGDESRLASQAVSSGVRCLVVCGGDGTVHGVLGALAYTGVILGILPSGRGNDLARSLGIPLRFAAALDVLVEGRVRSVDLGRIGNRYFGGVASVGFDAEVAHRARTGSRTGYGRAAYVLGGLGILRTFEFPELRLSGGFGTREGPMLLAAAGNGAFYGGGMRIAPEAVLDDGLLDLCLVHRLPRWKVPLLMPRVFAGRHMTHASVEYLRTPDLVIESDTTQIAAADGESAGKTPVEIRTAPGAPIVLSPAD